MEFREIDFYLESITESYRNTNLVKKGIHSNLVHHIRQNSSQKYYKYRTDKIGKSKSFLRCSIGKCSARLSVLHGEDLQTEKIGSVFVIFLQTILPDVVNQITMNTFFYKVGITV